MFFFSTAFIIFYYFERDNGMISYTAIDRSRRFFKNRFTTLPVTGRMRIRGGLRIRVLSFIFESSESDSFGELSWA